MSLKKFYIELDKDFVWRLFLLFCGISIIISTNEAAFAINNSGDDVIGQALCRVVNNLSGGIAQGIATVGIFALGVGFLTGRISWNVALTAATAVIIIFSAPKIVAYLSGDSDNSNCPTGT